MSLFVSIGYLDDLPELRERFVVRCNGYINPGCHVQLALAEREAVAEVDRAYSTLFNVADTASELFDWQRRKRSLDFENDIESPTDQEVVTESNNVDSNHDGDDRR